MKPQSYKLAIDNPCKQEWSSMTESETGKFCSHCSKTVTDLTALSDKDIIKIIEKTPGKLCGRLTRQQLNRQLLPIRQQSNASYFYKIFTGLLLLGITKNSFANDRHSKIELLSITESSNTSAQETNTNEVETVTTDSLKNVIQGKLIDAETNEPISFASIVIKGTETRITTDNEGKFKLIIPDDLLTEKIILTIMFVGYQQMEIVINKSELPLTKQLIMLRSSQVLLGDVCIIKEKKWWQFWK